MAGTWTGFARLSARSCAARTELPSIVVSSKLPGTVVRFMRLLYKCKRTQYILAEEGSHRVAGGCCFRRLLAHQAYLWPGAACIFHVSCAC